MMFFTCKHVTHTHTLSLSLYLIVWKLNMASEASVDRSSKLEFCYQIVHNVSVHHTLTPAVREKVKQWKKKR